ncbi:MAG: hypothetical protein H7Y09_08345 [Chitinophagaceae bacterium]|nr:hypothetical protein [Anaerolineae bacterium]
MHIIFNKTGQEIQEAVGNRIQQLQLRLDRRNVALDEFLKDIPKVRSFMIRQMASFSGGHRPSTLFSVDEISSEEVQEVRQLCSRIFAIEQEINRLTLIGRHVKEDQVFELSLDDLAAYGFDEFEVE